MFRSSAPIPLILAFLNDCLPLSRIELMRLIKKSQLQFELTVSAFLLFRCVKYVRQPSQINSICLQRPRINIADTMQYAVRVITVAFYERAVAFCTHTDTERKIFCGACLICVWHRQTNTCIFKYFFPSTNASK